jgi:hypothetical protein
LSASTLQKEAPKFFMMEGEIVGGTTSQPRQFLLAQAKPLYPLADLSYEHYDGLLDIKLGH